MQKVVLPVTSLARVLASPAGRADGSSTASASPPDVIGGLKVDVEGDELAVLLGLGAETSGITS